MSIAAVETAVEGVGAVAKVGLGAVSWLPWAIAGVAGLALMGAVGVQTVRLANAQAETAKSEKAFADFKEDLATQSLAVTQAAAKKSAEQYDALQASIGAIGQLGTQTKTEIHYVQSNGGPCVADPAWRATVGGVQRILDAGSPGGDQGKAGGGAPATLPGAGAPGPK